MVISTTGGLAILHERPSYHLSQVFVGLFLILVGCMTTAVI
ncbi:hypothetical protein [Lactiplantibacillus modestisalitolerans]|uniref:Uncharacterized protein n=1 Tax=Lactiplantibacillus modestisalitolerans TaxID=1457219 RepID=A0ABV5WW58_9LACO|nr:hypothetical protein [Lactiplantibacillus modestisalitolerans]